MTEHQIHQRGRMAIVSFALLGGALLGLLASPAGAATSAVASTEKTPAASCAGLASAAFPDTRITTAEAIPGGSRWKFPHSVFNVMAGPDPGTEATFCRVAGIIGKEQVELITTSARAACDHADGVPDGLAKEPLACPFKPADLSCKEGNSTGCLTPPEAARAAQVYGPARSPGGLELYPGNALFVPPLVVLPGAMQEPALLRIFPAPERTWTPETFDTDRDLPALRQRLDDKMAALKTDLTPFGKRGGKLLMYHGWHDALLSPYCTLAYRAGMSEAMAPEHFAGFQRLYMMPGVDHCAVGIGPDRIGPDRADFIGAMVAWVEEGKAPETLLATSRRPDGTTQARPLCPFPQVARHSGQGATDDANHWRCVNP